MRRAADERMRRVNKEMAKKRGRPRRRLHSGGDGRMTDRMAELDALLGHRARPGATSRPCARCGRTVGTARSIAPTAARTRNASTTPITTGATIGG